MPRRKTTCPACGNADPKYREDNGERANSPDLTYLCTKPGPSCDGESNDGICGMQWNPND